MSILESMLTGLALAMDAFAVAVCYASVPDNLSWRSSFKIAVFFGFSQSAMTFIGYHLSLFAYKYIEAYDHWIAFGILILLGLKMSKDALSKDETSPVCNRYSDPNNLVVLSSLSIATSIDALAIGVTIGFRESPIYSPAIIIGAVTFLVSLAGCFLGTQLEKYLKGKAELIGGVILIGIGIKVLVTG